MNKRQIIYNALPTISKFHHSKAFYRGLMGPVGSGKSVGCSNEAMRLMSNQEPCTDGIRRTRGVIVRNTYGELVDTTMRTWFQWFPPEIFGIYKENKRTQYIKFKDVECDVMFRAMDIPKDVRKVLSMEVSWVWINEAREVLKAIVDACGERVDRYPTKNVEGVPCTFPCVIMDTNPPDDDHWWYAIAERDPEALGRLRIPEEGINDETWAFFKQPGGLMEVDGKFVSNPKAENLENLNRGAGYYERLKIGKSKDHIRIYYCAQYGFVVDGKPVHPDYHDALHCSEEEIGFNKRFVLYIGLDFGTTPAAVFGQKLQNGRWVVIDELCMEDVDTGRFAEEIKKILSVKPYSEASEIEFWGDPSGSYRHETAPETSFQILHANGITAQPAIAETSKPNDTVIRRESLSSLLRKIIDGKPGILISPKCHMVRKGLKGGFCYKRVQVSGAERYQDKPDKNRFSHPVEALEYMLVGAGEGRSIVTPANPKPKPTTMTSKWKDDF